MMDLIYRHPSGAGLWQGGVHDVLEIAGHRDPRIRAIALTALQHQQLPIREDHYEVISAPLIDTDKMEPEAIALTAGIADMAATALANNLRLGRGALSSCAAGRNRSGLVSALVLMKVASYKPNEAVAIVRRQRTGADGPALSNDLFVEILHSLSGAVGSMTTWRKWKS